MMSTSPVDLTPTTPVGLTSATVVLEDCHVAVSVPSCFIQPESRGGPVNGRPPPISGAVPVTATEAVVGVAGGVGVVIAGVGGLPHAHMPSATAAALLDDANH